MTLYPPLQAWFTRTFPAMTEIQRRALPHTLAGSNTLILAPTGSGKTLSAFLSCLSGLGARAKAEGLPNAVCAVYVTPQKSLGRDIHRNLEEPLAAINASVDPGRQIRMEVRTGDTDLAVRGKQQRKRPHLLLTTPESLSALLSQKGWTDGFATTCVIVDELHALAESKRGSLLALTLERLEAKTQRPLQRIGLSATAWPVDVVCRLLCGVRLCSVAALDPQKAHRLEIAVPAEDLGLPPAGHNPYRVAQPVADLVEAAQCSLVFVSTRSAAERLGLALKILLPQFDERIGVHHSSIDRAGRLAIEAGLAEGTMKAVVCSSSLELGVDFQSVDQVLLVGTPRGVSRALQRLGRSGHRVDGIAAGSLVPLSLPDVLQAVALRRAAEQGRLDALRVPCAPLDVLAQVLLGMSIERPWSLDLAYKLVRCSGPYAGLGRADFDSVIEYLSGGGKVLGPYGTYGKIAVDGGEFRVASQKVARQYYMNAGTISGDYKVKIVSRGNRKLGEVEEQFIASLQPGDAFTIGGKVVAVERLHQNTAVVKPAQGQRVQTPRWMGAKMPLTARLASEELELRGDLRRAWETGGRAACHETLGQRWKVRPDVIERILTFLERQNRAAPIPAASPVQVERVREGRSLLILFHVVAGRAINRSLAWVVGHRLGNVGSIVANHDDHSFLFSISRRNAPDEARLRDSFDPANFRQDLRTILEQSEMLGRSFRPVAETGQLIQRRSHLGMNSPKASSWNGSLLYTTLMKHEPDHPLVREVVREVMFDLMDVDRAAEMAAQIHQADWEVFDLQRPSPFAIPLFAAFSRETLLAQDPERALDEMVAALYAGWEPEPFA